MIIEFGVKEETAAPRILFPLERSVIQRWKFSWPVRKNPLPHPAYSHLQRHKGQ